MSRLLDDVVGELSRLPGVGRRTALRLAMHMLRMEMQDVELMAGGDLPFPQRNPLLFALQQPFRQRHL